MGTIAAEQTLTPQAKMPGERDACSAFRCRNCSNRAPESGQCHGLAFCRPGSVSEVYVNYCDGVAAGLVPQLSDAEAGSLGLAEIQRRIGIASNCVGCAMSPGMIDEWGVSQVTSSRLLNRAACVSGLGLSRIPRATYSQLSRSNVRSASKAIGVDWFQASIVLSGNLADQRRRIAGGR